jgi:hypothetical protein
MWFPLEQAFEASENIFLSFCQGYGLYLIVVIVKQLATSYEH